MLPYELEKNRESIVFIESNQLMIITQDNTGFLVDDLEH